MAQNTQAQGFYKSIGFVERETSGAIQMVLALDLRVLRAPS
jgi:ribosomal protein S18 acetylase RimI-like enzyme